MSGWTQCKLLRLRLRRRYNKNRAIIELQSIADRCACTTAWSQRSWSFDRPVRTGDVTKSQVVLSPFRSAAAGRSKTGMCERGLTFQKSEGLNSKPDKQYLLWIPGISLTRGKVIFFLSRSWRRIRTFIREVGSYPPNCTESWTRKQ
jgi:hypothetical protein